jgi:hypothetical protein
MARGYDGFVAFTAKSKLVNHYIEMLGAKPLYGDTLSIDTLAAKILIERYYNE